MKAKKSLIKSKFRSFLSSLFHKEHASTNEASSSSEYPVDSEELYRLIGGGDFKIVGNEFLDYFINLGRLQPFDRVLDVGCGAGRMAVPLTGYLKNKGSYEGFDLLKDLVQWCSANITPSYPNFNFRAINVYNKFYNVTGISKGSEYKFPFEDHSFDFVFLTSVFTHMLPDEMENYLSEISRVMKINARCLITFFLLNNESNQLIDNHQSNIEFKYKLDNCQVNDANIPEAVIAFEESFIQKMFIKYNLVIDSPVQYGSWCGRKDFLSFQDILVASKKNN
ncbi:MAG: class I SAM-dependent methyltransferase [Saprospiraceae bacterium]